MLKSLSDKFTNIAAGFYDRASAWAGKASVFFRLPQFSSWLARRLSKPAGLVGLESFVALSLVVYFFFLMLPESGAPRSYDGNEMNYYLFTYLSDHPYPLPHHKNLLAGFDNWKARLPGPMITGWVHDVALKICAHRSRLNPADADKLYFGGYYFLMPAVAFGFYHALWLFLLFGILILHRRDALLIMLGVFSGLMYNFTIPAGKWFYPWDMPAMFFFTWACLLYDKRQLFPLMAVVWLGSLFKETTLCCALLILMAGHWPWKKRIAGFAVTLIGCLLTRKLLMAAYGVKTMFFALNNAENAHELVLKTWGVLLDNLHLLFGASLNHVLFTNAGALFIMMLIPWRNRRDIVFKILAVVFIIGQFLCGIIVEFRIWYEILPLGWMVISETLLNRFPVFGHGPADSAPWQPDPVANDRTNRVMQGSYWLMILSIGLILFGILSVLGLALLVMKY